MKCVSALSTVRNTDDAAREVVERIAAGLAGAPGDLALVFASMHHAEALGKVAEAIRAQGIARHVLGCTGETILGDDREVEGEAALSLWVLHCPGIRLRPFSVPFDEDAFQGPPDPASPQGSGTMILLGDPFTFQAEALLKTAHEKAKGLQIVGGMASGSQSPGANRLVLDGKVFDRGAVAVVIDGPIRLRTVVSQGCRPIGRTLIVTKIDGNVIRELGRRPALEVLRELFESLDPGEQALVQRGLHIGRVINEYQETFRRGDFLVRNVLGADDAGGIAINDLIRVGQTVQFHVRDAATADEDLRALLEGARPEPGGSRVAGALVFSCNGRGTRLFETPDHDAGMIRALLGPIPLAGFFAMGELGPVGGQNFMHGFTASVVLVEAPETT